VSLELHVFLKREAVPDRPRWQASVNAFGFPLELYCELRPVQDTGFSPCQLKGGLTGFEIFPGPSKDVLEVYREIAERIGDRDFVITFRWGGDFKECACVMIAAAALVQDYSAIAYYPADSQICSADQLLADARECLKTARLE